MHIIRSVAATLTYAHEQAGTRPVIHRDVKPANIMVDKERVYLIDWSKSRVGEGNTLTNTQLSSPDYSAPEVEEGRTVSPATDVYGLAKVLAHYFLGEAFKEKKGIVTKEDFKDKNIPARVADVLLQATQADPQKRYASVREFMEQLEGAKISKYGLWQNLRDVFRFQKTPGLQYAIAIAKAKKLSRSGQGDLEAILGEAQQLAETAGVAMIGTAERGALRKTYQARQIRSSQPSFQIGFGNKAKDVAKVQVSIGGNIAKGNVTGVQASGIFNGAEGNVAGVQVGAVNLSLEELVGVQVGLICYAKEGTYLQVGLLTARGVGPWYTRITPLVGYHRGRKENK